MALQNLHRHVARLFSTSATRGTRIGVEHELRTVAADGGAAPIDSVRRAAAGAWYAEALGFEPGGQVELSLAPAAAPGALGDDLRCAVDALSAGCARVGIALDAVPVDTRPDGQVPLQLSTKRYRAMERHFDTVGPAGRRMMRRTASTQLCFDWWPGLAGLEQWRLLNLAGPSLAAVSARSVGPGSRLDTWLQVDPARTAFDGRLLAGHDPVAAYTAFAAGASPFTRPGDVDQHLTTLFPPVRPRGRYLEVRFLDVQPVGLVAGIAAAFAGLLYDDVRRRWALRMLAGPAERLGQEWQQAAHGDPELVERGRLLSTADTGELGGAA